MPENHRMPESNRTLAVFMDFENLALGFKDRPDRFDVSRVLSRLVEKGNIVVKRAYADWGRFSSYTQKMHEAAIELIEIPKRRMTGKNSADIRLCVDVMDLCYSKEHINTFVIISGDSDFSPLVSKLKENGKVVIGLGMREATSDLLRDNCDEFIYYEDLESEDRDVKATASLVRDMNESHQSVFSLLLASCYALRREEYDTLYASLIKETMKRKDPAFTERSYGYKSFHRLLEDAEKKGLVKLAMDDAGRTLIVDKVGEELKEKPKRRRRVRRRRTPKDKEEQPAEQQKEE
jgi:uncharacterized protein (TIGR00288 family)